MTNIMLVSNKLVIIDMLSIKVSLIQNYHEIG